MGLNLLPLENRETPNATFDFPVNISFVASQDMQAYAARPGGGPRVEVQQFGKVIFNQFVFEDDFRGGVDASLVDLNRDGFMDLVVAAGPGGGPRVKVFVNNGGNFVQVQDKFVADPSFRGGIHVDSNGYTSPGYTFKNEPSYPQQILFATSLDGTDVSSINYQLQFVPPSVAHYLVNNGIQINVFTGDGITALPLFARFRGVQTDAGGDGTRTWDTVPAATVDQRIYMNTSDPVSVLHEIGHVVESTLSVDQINQWKAIWSTTVWADAYQKQNEFEAFADSFAGWMINQGKFQWMTGRQPTPNQRISSYFDGLDLR